MKLNENKLRQIIRESILEVLDNNKDYYVAEIYNIFDEGVIDEKSFDTLQDACNWTQQSVEGPDATYPDYPANIFYVDEQGQYNETNCKYGNW